MYKLGKIFPLLRKSNVVFRKIYPRPTAALSLLNDTFHTRLYADDTALFMCDKSLDAPNKKVNNELINIDRWLKSNKLSLNYAKTKFMIISHDKNAKSSLKLR